MKEKSKKQIKGHIAMFLLINIIVLALAMVAYIPVVGWIALLLFYPFITFSLVRIYWNFVTKGEEPAPSGLFKKDFGKMWGKAWVMDVLIGIFTLLWSILLIVPGIIKGISYSASPYILAENPEMSGLEAIRESKKKMYGHKADYFVLMLSFIGWMLLACLTLGILYIWLAPYMATAQAI